MMLVFFQLLAQLDDEVIDRAVRGIGFDAPDLAVGRREVDDPAAAAERDAVEEHGDLLGRGAAQGERGELTEAAERAHGGAGAATEQLGEGVGRARAGGVGEVDAGGEAGAPGVEGALRVLAVAAAVGDDGAVPAGLRDRCRARRSGQRGALVADQGGRAGARAREARGEGASEETAPVGARGRGDRGDDGE